MKIVILVSGKQGSGKSSLTQALLNKLPWHGFRATALKFAEPLYRMHDACQKILREYGIERPPIDGDFLQIIGEEYGRQRIGQNVWVECARPTVAKAFAEEKQVVIFDDTRYPNELLLNAGADRTLWIRLECREEVRKARRGSKWRTNTNHPSEVGLDFVPKWDLVIDTEFTKPEEAAEKIISLLQLPDRGAGCK